MELGEARKATQNLEEDAGLVAIDRRTQAFQSLRPGHVRRSAGGTSRSFAVSMKRTLLVQLEDLTSGGCDWRERAFHPVAPLSIDTPWRISSSERPMRTDLSVPGTE